MYNSSTLDSLDTGADSPSLRATLSPGIVGLFVQGLESGLVLAQLSSWLSFPECTEGPLVVTLTVFVTAVGFLQAGICFASALRTYVEKFGQPVAMEWTELVQPLLTTIIAAPIQSLLIRRCYHILRPGGNLYVIVSLSAFVIVLLNTSRLAESKISIQILLIFLLLGSVILSILVTIGLLLPNTLGGPKAHPDTLWPPFILNGVFLTLLDIGISYILLHYLTQTRKRVYAEQKRQRIAYLIAVVWQSAVPPTVCTITLTLMYTISIRLHSHFRRFSEALEQMQLVMWFPTLQTMIGKLYILSLFYNLNARTLFVGERPMDTAHSTSLTVPTFNGMGIAGVDACEAQQSTPRRHLFADNSADEIRQ